MSLSSNNTDDTRVVSLVFDNSKFEPNAKQSISTLGKLKNALNESVKVKIFDDINSGVRSVNVEPIISGINEVTAKFSTLTSITDQWKRRIADNVFDAVTGIVKSSTIGQLTAGWAKYEEKTQSVQTIMAATARDWANESAQMEYVGAQLEKLNWYSDETSASLSDMTDNISKFVNNGVSIEDATTALMGVSNWAYISGANIQQAGRAMYNLSQAMGVGNVKLQDWMSIENAQMATMEFKQTVLETGEAMGLLEKASDDTWKSLETGTEITLAGFREDLKDGWFTSELLVESLRKYSNYTEAIYNSLKRLGHGITATDLMGWVDDYMDKSLDVAAVADKVKVSADFLRGELEALSSSEYDLSRRATKAAQEAKTLSEALGSVKDAASTAWMTIYETLFGNYLTQKGFWTNVSNTLYDAFISPVAAIGYAIESAFEHEAIIGQKEWELLKSQGLVSDNNIDEIIEYGKKFGYITDEMAVSAKNFTESLDDGWFTSGLIRKMWDYRDGQLQASKATKEGIKDIRDFHAMAVKLRDDPTLGQGSELFGWKTDFEEAGFNMDAYNFYVQQIIDGYTDLEAKIGDAAYVTDDIIDAADNALLAYLGFTDGSSEATEAYIEKLNEEGDAYDRLCENVAELGRYVTETDDEGNTKQVLAKMDTAYYWGEALKDVLFSLGQIVKVIGEEFQKVFGKSTQQGVQHLVLSIYDTVERFKAFVMTSQTFRDVLDIIFSVGKIVFTMFTRKLGLISTIINSILTGVTGEENTISNLVHTIAEAITKFADWFAETNLFKEGFGLLGDIIGDATSNIREWFSTLGKGEGETEGILSKIGGGLVEAFKTLGDLFGGLRIKYKEYKNMLGNLGDKTFFEKFDVFKKTILDYITNFKGFDKIKSAFGDLKKIVKDSLKKIGIDVDGIMDVFESIGETASPGLNWLFTKGQELVGNISTIFGSFTTSTLNKVNLSKFKAAFGDFFSSLGPWFDELKSKWGDFREAVKDQGGFHLSNLGQIFSDFHDIIVEHFSNFKGFDGFKEAFKGLWEDIDAKLQEAGIDIPGFFDTITSKLQDFRTALESNPVVQTITSIFKDVSDKISGYVEDMGGLEGFADAVADKWESLKNVAGIIVSAFSVVKDGIAKALDFISGKFDSFDIPESLAMLFGIKTKTATGGGGGHFEEAETDNVVAAIVKAKESVKEFTREVSGLSKSEFTIPAWLGQLKDEVLALAFAFMAYKSVANVTGVIAGMNSLKEAMASSIKKSNALKIAAAIGILAGTVYALSTLTPDQILVGSFVTGILAAVLVGITALLAKINATGGVFTSGMGILAIAAAIGMLAGVMYLIGLLSSILPGDMTAGVAYVAIATLMLGGLLAAAAALGVIALPAAGSILSVAIAIGMLAVVSWLMGHANFKSIGIGAVTIIGAMTLLALMFKAMNKFKIDASAPAKGMKDVGVALLAIAAVIVILQFINPSRWLNILVGLGSVLVAFFAICGTLALFKGVLKKTGSTFKNLAILIGTLAGAVILLGLIPSGIVLQGELALLGIIGILSILLLAMGLSNKLGGNLDKMAKTITRLAILTGVIGVVLAIMAGIIGERDPGEYLTMAESIAIVMAAIAGIAIAMILPSKYMKDSRSALKAMLVAILGAVAAAAALWIASQAVGDPQKLLSVAESLGLVMIAIAALMAATAIPAKFGGESIVPALKALGVAILAAVAVAVALWVASSNISDTDKLLTIAESISLVMLAIAAVMAAVAIPANLVTGGKLLPALGAMALAIGAMAAVAFALTEVANSVENPDNLVKAAEGIALGLAAIVVVAALMGVIGLMSGAVAAGAVAVGIIVLAVLGMGFLISQIPKDEVDDQIEAIKKLGELMAAVGDAIGEIIGGFIGGIGAGIVRSIDGVSSTLVHLSKMMSFVDADAIEQGTESLRRINSALLDTVWTDFLTSTLSALLGADTAGSLAAFKSNADTLADTMVEFSDKLMEVSSIYVPATEIQALSDAIKSLPFDRGGFLSLFTGDDAPKKSDVETFKQVGILLADAVVAFDKALPSDMHVDRVDAAASMLNGMGLLAQAAVAANAQGEGIRRLINSGGFGTGDTDFTDFIGTIGTKIAEISNYDYNVSNLAALDSSMGEISSIVGSFNGMTLPTGDINNVSRVERIFGNITTIATTFDDIKDKDVSKAEEIKDAIEKMNSITFEGDITDTTKVDDFVANANSLIDVFLDVAEKAVAARTDLSGEMSDPVDTQGTTNALMDAVQNLIPTDKIKEYLPEGGFESMLGQYFGVDENGRFDPLSMIPEGMDLKGEILGKLGFGEDGTGLNLFGDGTFADQLTAYFGADANGNLDLNGLGLGDLESSLSGLTGDFNGLTSALSGDGKNSLASLLDGLGDTLGEQGGTNDQLRELQNILGGLGDEANGIDSEGVLGSLDELYDKLNLDENGVGSLDCKLVLDTTDYDQAIEDLMNGVTTDGFMASPNVNNLIEASIDLSPLETAIDGLKEDNSIGLANVQTAISNLSTDIDNLSQAMQSIQMILDTGTLVGEIAPLVDAELGVGFG